MIQGGAHTLGFRRWRRVWLHFCEAFWTPGGDAPKAIRTMRSAAPKRWWRSARRQPWPVRR